MRSGPSRATVGPGKPFSWGPITTSVCAEIEMPKASRGRKRREGCPPHHPTRGPGEHRKLAQESQPKMDFIMHISGQKEATWNTLFSIFERWRGPLNVAGPGKLSPLSPLSTGLDAAALMPLLCCGCCCCL